MDLATVDKLLTTTRSVRRRLDLTRKVEREVIERCLEIAVQAPTGGNNPRYHFTGDDFKPAKRIPARERTYWDGWGNTH